MNSGVRFNLDIPSKSDLKQALPQATPEASKSACKFGAACYGFQNCKPNNRGKGRGNQQPSQAEIDAKTAQAIATKAEADAKTAEANARSLRAQADAAEAQARLNAAQSTAVVTSTPGAKPGATSGGGDYITRDEFNSLQSEVKAGFIHLSQQNQQTHEVLAGFIKIVNSGLPASAAAPLSRQIGYVPASEVAVEQQRQISYGQTAERSGFAQPPTLRASSAITCGGGAATEFSEFARHQEAPTFFRESSGGSTLVAARQLGVSHSLPNFEAAAARWNTRRDANNAKILCIIRQTACGNDNMACLLLALVNSKTLSEIDKMYSAEVGKLLTVQNTPFFQGFFQSLTGCGLPEKFDVKVDSSKTKSGYGFCMTYQKLSQMPGNVDKLVMILRGE
jgi:hypothetical protein